MKVCGKRWDAGSILEGATSKKGEPTKNQSTNVA